jgi:hypothetical protein
MILQNGFELDGNINTFKEQINNLWVEILIIETNLETNELRELFKNNNIIIENKGDIETTYFTNGLIDIKTQDSKNYVWLYFDHSNINNTNQELKSKLANVLKSDLNFETINFLYSMNQATKDNIFEYVKNGNITQADYLTITGENCPELPLEILKQLKINELDRICKDTIYNKFYSSADGANKLYDLDTDHQVRLSAKKFEILFTQSQGKTVSPISYYAKGEDCHDYSAEQFLQLTQDAEDWVTNNTTKYKKIKEYVTSLNAETDRATIEAVNWNTVIPTSTNTTTPTA